MIYCAYCKKAIHKNAKVDTHRKKLGNSSLSKVSYYHPECFKLVQKERANYEHTKKERINKRKNNR